MIVRDLLIAIGFRVDERKIDRVNRGIRNVKRNAGDTNRTVTGLSRGLRGVVGGFLGIAAVTRGGRFLAGTISQFQKLRAQLVTIEQDERKAEAAFDRLQEFATTTPFQLQNVVSSFARLRAVGIDPTLDDMRAIGDVSAGMGKDITAFSDAVVAASTGRTRMLKQFGIVASQQGDEIAFTFKGQRTVVKKNAEDISRFLFDLGKTEFAGGMERQMETIGGATSNLIDNLAKFADAVGEAGAAKEINLFVRELTDAAGEGDSLAVILGRTLGFALRTLRELLRFARENADLLALALGSLAAGKIIVGLLELVAWARTLNAAMIPLTVKIGLVVAALLLLAIAIEDIVAFTSGEESLLGDIDKAIQESEDLKTAIFAVLGALLLVLALLNAPLAVILATIAGIVLLASHWDQVTAAFLNFASQIPGAFANFFRQVLTFFAQLIGLLILETLLFLDEVGTALAEWAAELWFPVEDEFNDLVANLKQMWTEFTEFVSDLIDGLLGELLALPERAGEAFGEIPGLSTAIEVAEDARKRFFGGDGDHPPGSGLPPGGSAGLLADMIGGGAADPSADAERRMREVQNNRSTSLTIPSVTVPMTFAGAADPQSTSLAVEDTVTSVFDRLLRDALADADGGVE